MLKPLEYLYLLVAAIEIFAEITDNTMLRFISKPLLMIVLIAFYVKAVAGKWDRMHKMMAVAFFFSWVGDVALMFVYKNENFFLVGLVGFLITHVLYALAFLRVTDRKSEPLMPKKLWVMSPLIVYMAVLLYFLIPAISGNALTKPFLIPVLIHTTAIANMVAFAINRFARVNQQSFALVFQGALLFMFSDSIIAVNKFLHPFATASIFIMILYTLGQYLIAKGMLAQEIGEEEPEDSND